MHVTTSTKHQRHGFQFRLLLKEKKMMISKTHFRLMNFYWRRIFKLMIYYHPTTDNFSKKLIAEEENENQLKIIPSNFKDQF